MTRDQTNEDTARAFSGHHFEETYDRIAEQATWNLVGQTRIKGRAAIIEACCSTAQENNNVETTWLRFISTGTGDIVAVDAIGRYTGPEEVSMVSSCDIFEFTGEFITTITSYAVELPESAHPAAGT
jgi:hypothetical protein